MDEFPVIHIPDDELLEEEEFEKLYSASDKIVVLLSLFYGSISILAVVGNTLVIWVVATTRQMRTVTNMYIANLAFADVIIGLFCIPFQFQAALLQRWNLPWFMCGFCPFVQALSVNVSVFTLTAIAIDRHRAIINPLRARPTKFISKIIIATIWVVALTFAIPCAIAFRVEWMHERFKEGEVIYNVSRPFCMNKNLSDDQLQSYRYTLVFVQYLVPFCVISFVYIQMAIKLWGTQTPGNAQDTRDITLLRNKKKVIKMLIIVVIVFGLCWLPLQLYNILYVTIPEINEYHFISIVWFVCDWLAMSNSCYNPFIYGIYNEKFKREFNKRFAACFCKFHTSLEQQDRTLSMHTRASSIRSTYANSSMRIRSVKHLSLNNYTFNTTSLGGGGGGYGVGGGQRNGVVALRGLKNANGCGVYSTMENRPLSEGALTGRTAERESYQWRRNNFKPLYPNVIEHEDDDLGLMDMQSSSSASGELTPGHANGKHSSAAALPLVLQAQTKTAATPTTNSAIGTASGGAESRRCICEQELGSHNACDGTCILSEVSRVQAPAVASSDQATIPTPMATNRATPTASPGSAQNNGSADSTRRHVDFNMSNERSAQPTGCLLLDMTANISEYTPLTTRGGAGAPV